MARQPPDVVARHVGGDVLNVRARADRGPAPNGLGQSAQQAGECYLVRANNGRTSMGGPSQEIFAVIDETPHFANNLANGLNMSYNTNI